MQQHDPFEKIVAAFLRDTFSQRYDLENIRKYARFDALSDAQIIALRDFGLRYIYPEWEERCFQHTAFTALTTLLNTPIRLKPLVTAALKSMWRLGRKLPRAIEAGKKVIHAFEAIQHLETHVIAELREKFPTTDVLEEKEIIQGIAAIPREEFEDFINDRTALMQLLAERSLLTAGCKLLENIGDTMEKRSDYYSRTERDGLRYAVQVVQGCMTLFEEFDDMAVQKAIAAIPQVERDWYDSCL
ncbi:MAG: hypothetical protein KAH38_00490 [Candidatus Hydrogenedentes bacterium]|nr:hypothetical protein [Candidatus Hydrogenedentota bacterium]